MFSSYSKIYIYIYIYVCVGGGGVWNDHHSGQKPKKQLGHGEGLGLGLCTERSARKEVNHERAESWIVLSVENKVEYHGKSIPTEEGKVLTYPGHVAQISNI